MYHREFGDGGGWGDGGAATVGVVGAAHRELGGEQHHGEHRAGPTKDHDLSGYEAHQVKWALTV